MFQVHTHYTLAVRKTLKIARQYIRNIGFARCSAAQCPEGAARNGGGWALHRRRIGRRALHQRRMRLGVEPPLAHHHFDGVAGNQADQAERLCNRVAIVKNGAVAAEGTLADLRAGFGQDRSLEQLFFELTESASA